MNVFYSSQIFHLARWRLFFYLFNLIYAFFFPQVRGFWLKGQVIKKTIHCKNGFLSFLHTEKVIPGLYHTQFFTTVMTLSDGRKRRKKKLYATICSINISNPGKSKASGLLLYNKYTNKNMDSEQVCIRYTNLIKIFSGMWAFFTCESLITVMFRPVLVYPVTFINTLFHVGFRLNTWSWNSTIFFHQLE